MASDAENSLQIAQLDFTQDIQPMLPDSTSRKTKSFIDKAIQTAIISNKTNSLFRIKVSLVFKINCYKLLFFLFTIAQLQNSYLLVYSKKNFGGERVAKGQQF